MLELTLGLKNNNADAETKQSLEPTTEKLSVKPRFVVFGSRISGAYGAANAFEDHLSKLGFDDPKVDAVRDAAFIKDAFYNVRPDFQPAEIESKEGSSKLRRLGRAIMRREVSPPQEQVDIDVPQGVIVFPQMRQYTLSGTGMFIPSPRDYIQDLCDTNNVPVIFMEDVLTEADLAASVSAFAIESK